MLYQLSYRGTGVVPGGIPPRKTDDEDRAYLRLGQSDIGRARARMMLPYLAWARFAVFSLIPSSFKRMLQTTV
jgi:hypothetical protein